MKKVIKVHLNGKVEEREINYIPIRYIVALFLSLLETVMVIGLVVVLSIYVPYFYIASIITQVVVSIAIICSNDNPDYKIPWLLAVILLPIIGYMLYFLFYKRKLSKKFIKRYEKIEDTLVKDNNAEFNILKDNDQLIYSQALLLTKLANTNVYNDTQVKYFKIGEEFFVDVIKELKEAKKFIFFEFFIVEEGLFWNSILEVLKEKVKESVEVKVIWDDIGCMSTLPGNYYKELRKSGIDACVFSRLKGQADSEFNNRNHRKILIIDGKISYTGGINIADEYINYKEKYGHWKDFGIKLIGNATNELTKLFLIDFYTNNIKEEHDFLKYYTNQENKKSSFVIPFGDGPKPIYKENVGKMVIMNILNHAKDYVYISTPYLIIDAQLLETIKNTAIRGVEVRLILPHIPDKKMVFEMTRSNYKFLIDAGVKIYEYEPGFIHGKLYLSDDNLAMIGTINLDYRSLTHHYENGVWIYNDSEILKMKEDFLETLDKSIYINENEIKENIFKKLIRIIVRIFSPLL